MSEGTSTVRSRPTSNRGPSSSRNERSQPRNQPTSGEGQATAPTREELLRQLLAHQDAQSTTGFDRPESPSAQRFDSRLLQRQLRGQSTIRCHQPQTSGFQAGLSNDYQSLSSYFQRSGVRRGLGPSLVDAPLRPGLEQGFADLRELPNFSVGLSRGRLSFSTEDLPALAQAGLGSIDRRAQTALDGVRSASITADAFRIDREGEARIQLGRQVPIVGRLEAVVLGDLSGKLDVDDTPGSSRLAISDLRGAELELEGGKRLQIHGLSIARGGQPRGDDESSPGQGPGPMLSVTVDNPATRPSWTPEALWPKTVTVPLPASALGLGLDDEQVGSAASLVQQVLGGLQEGQLAPALRSLIPGSSTLPSEATSVLDSITGFSKEGDTLSLTRSSSSQHDLGGGATLRLGSRLEVELGDDPRAPSFEQIRGIHVQAPLPRQLGAGDNHLAAITSVALGRVRTRSNGPDERSLTVETDGLLRSGRLDVDDGFEPVRDARGGFDVQTRLDNPLSRNPRDSLRFELRIGADGQPDVSASDLADLASRASWQARERSAAGAGMVVISAATRIASGVLNFFGG